jgi:hypothetical protein
LRFKKKGFGDSEAPPDYSLRLIAQQELLYFTGGGFWQGAKDNRFRNLEARKMGAAVGDNFGLGGLVAVFQGDEGTGGFAPFFIGPGNDGGFQNGRMGVEHALHFNRRDILAA